MIDAVFHHLSVLTSLHHLYRQAPTAQEESWPHVGLEGAVRMGCNWNWKLLANNTLSVGEA